DTCLRIEHPEAARQVPLDVGEHGEGQIPQLVLLPPPGKVHELAVDADAEHLCVAGLELFVQPAESGDLGRTDEGEVLRPEEDDLPLAGKAVLGDGLEGAVEAARDHAGEGEIGEMLTNA